LDSNANFKYGSYSILSQRSRLGLAPFVLFVVNLPFYRDINAEGSVGSSDPELGRRGADEGRTVLATSSG
jgi:hypothetical protein